MPHSKYLKALHACDGPWAATCSQGTNFQERQDQQIYPIILEQSKWSMKRGISDSEITVSNGVEFPVRMDLSLFLASFSITGSSSCLGDVQNSIFISLVNKILFFHPSAFITSHILKHFS